MPIDATHEGGRQIRYTPLGHFQLSVTTVVSLPSLPDRKRIRRAVITTVDQPLNWRDDGSDPTTTVGGYLEAGATLVYDGDMELFRMCTDARATAAADVRVAYHGL